MTLGRLDEQRDFYQVLSWGRRFLWWSKLVGDTMPGLQTLEELAALFSCKPFKPRSWAVDTSRLPSPLRLCFL